MPKETLRPKARHDECVCCRAPLADGAADVPFRVVDALDASKVEAWCPQCFVWRRAPAEPDRFHPDSYHAVLCTGCGKKSVAIGGVACMQCASRVPPLVLPPRDARLA